MNRDDRRQHRLVTWGWLILAFALLAPTIVYQFKASLIAVVGILAPIIILVGLAMGVWYVIRMYLSRY